MSTILALHTRIQSLLAELVPLRAAVAHHHERIGWANWVRTKMTDPVRTAAHVAHADAVEQAAIAGLVGSQAAFDAKRDGM